MCDAVRKYKGLHLDPSHTGYDTFNLSERYEQVQQSKRNQKNTACL